MPSSTQRASSRGSWRFPLEFGSFRPLLIRREHIALGIARRLRILYASDLHLGHWWTRRVADHLLDAARLASPHLILLGGDLADSVTALPRLENLVRKLRQVAPVHAIPGNHDERAGLSRPRAAVVAGGGGWLPDRPIDGPVRIDGVLGAASSQAPRILCAHFPSVFPAAVAAAYRLVLAGHLHGGQCVLGTWNDKLYPAAWLHRWHGLRFRAGPATMLVSRGAADTFPFRFNCPREVLLCEIS